MSSITLVSKSVLQSLKSLFVHDVSDNLWRNYAIVMLAGVSSQQVLYKYCLLKVKSWEDAASLKHVLEVTGKQLTCSRCVSVCSRKLELSVRTWPWLHCFPQRTSTERKKEKRKRFNLNLI